MKKNILYVVKCFSVIRFLTQIVLYFQCVKAQKQKKAFVEFSEVVKGHSEF